MPEKRFVRRKNSILDQDSLVSTQEQARLLNDPAVPIDHLHVPSREQNVEDQRKGAPHQIPLRGRESTGSEEAA
jgi:hypothetical protein